MKKIIIILCITTLLLLINYKKEKTITYSLNYYGKDINTFDNFILNFEDCTFNTNNFLNKLSNLKKEEFKILEIVPYNKIFNEFLYYSNDLNYILNSFKNNYIQYMINNNSYVTNICISNIKINTSIKNLNLLKDNIYFTY